MFTGEPAIISEILDSIGEDSKDLETETCWEKMSPVSDDYMCSWGVPKVSTQSSLKI